MKRWTRNGPRAAAIWAVIFLLCGAGSVAARQPEQHLKLTATIYRDPFSDQNRVDGPKEFVRGERLYLRIEGVLDNGWHTYPVLAANLNAGQVQRADVRFLNSSAFSRLGEPTEQPLPELVDEGNGNGFLREHLKPFVWTWPIQVLPTATPGENPLKVAIKAEVCDERHCVNETHELSVPVTISSLPSIESVAPTPPGPPGGDRGNTLVNGGTTTPVPDAPSSSEASNSNWQNYIIELVPIGQSDNSLWATIITALIAGLVSLLTPCVFPMIPITVSYFIKQGEKKQHSTLMLASVYCGTIVAVMTAGGIVLGSVLQVIIQHYVTNLLLAGVFVFFALSLLGMYEIMLPSGLSDLTSKRQGKGGLLGVMFMALTFSIISFACVGPIFGGFITLQTVDASSAAGWLKRVLAPLAFALAFALPFFVLALFPTLLRSLPKSGSWMNSVKVVMGFLELAAAFKFIRAAELYFLIDTQYFTYDMVIGIYVALSVACGLYLLGVYRLPHDHEAPESIGVLRLLWAIAFLSLGLYLVPALFKDDSGHSQRPKGIVYAWVSSSLLPEDTSGWNGNLYKALARGESENKPVFIDFTGVSCTNCKLNENNIFSNPAVEAEFKNFVVVRLYTDVLPSGVEQMPNASGAEMFRNEKFQNYALPYYVVLQPKGKVLRQLGAYDKGRIDSPEEFVEFLRQARARSN